MLGKQERIIPIDIQDEMQTAYMDYSMSVIISRRCRMCATASSLPSGASLSP